MSGTLDRRHEFESDGDSSSDRDPVEELAAEFATRFRNGERVSVEEYASRHPDLADEIRDLFPTIVAVEQLHTKRLMDANPTCPEAPKQLGDYRIIAEVARGGMGIVYEAEQVSLGRRVAVKVLPPHALRRERDIRRFEREAQTAANLHHSNIVPVFGVGEDSGQRYIVMQLIRGVGMDEILNEIRGVVVERQGPEKPAMTSRTSIAKRSAADLLESELKLNSTSVVANTETVEIPLTATPTTAQLKPLAITATVGVEYFKNVARVGMQAAEALQYAHQHDTLHRDIKPGNLLLDEDGRVWIADFGLAKAIQDDDVTCSGDIVGTMAYVAPERFQGQTTKASDVYSLGVTLHEMLTLQKVFTGEDRVAVMNQVTNEGLPRPRKLNRAVPRDLETIVQKAAARNPKDRYATAGHLARDLEAFLDGRPIEARRLSYVEHFARWCGRNRSLAGLAATVFLLATTVFGLLAFGYKHAEEQRQKSDVTSQLAIDALDEIYDRFAAQSRLSDSLGQDLPSDELADAEMPQMPISKDVALLLENLLEFYEELATQADESDAVTAKYITANRRVGDIKRQLKQSDGARVSYQSAIKHIKRLNPSLRNTAAMRLETARAYNGLGMTFSSWHGSRERAKTHRQAVDILEIPNATDAEQFELATSLFLLHSAERISFRRSNRSKKNRDHKRSGGQDNDAMNDAELKISHLDRVENILSDLKQRAPNRPDYDLLLARCFLAKSDPLVDGGALDEYQNRAIVILEDLISRYPENGDYQFELGQIYQKIERPIYWNRHGNEFRDEQLAVFETRVREGLAATKDLEVLHPNIPKYYQLKKELHEFLAYALRKKGEFAEAESQYLQAIQMQRMLISRDERPHMHRPWLFMLQRELGKTLRDAGDWERAKTSLEETADSLEEAIANSQNQQKHSDHRRNARNRFLDLNRQTLMSTYFVLANVLENLGDDQSAADLRSQAEQIGR